MKKTLFLLVPAFALLFCSFIPADWVAFQNTEGKFKMLFPRQPVKSVQDLSESGFDLKMNIFLYDASKYKDDNEAYLIMFCDYPDTLISSEFKDEILDSFFSKGIEGAAKNMQGTVTSMQKITYKEFPGRKVKISFMEGKGIGYMIMYLVNSRAYILEVVCEPLKDKNASIDKFLNSFALVDNKK